MKCQNIHCLECDVFGLRPKPAASHISWNSYSVLWLRFVMFSFAVLIFGRNTQRTRLLLSILIHFQPTSLLKIKDGKVCLFLSICIRRHFSNEFSDSVCVKNIEDTNKNIFSCYSHCWIWCNRWILLWCCYTLLIVSTCNLYLLSCDGYPLYNTEGIIGQDVLRII